MADTDESMLLSPNVLDDREFLGKVIQAASMPSLDAYKFLYGGKEPDSGMWPITPPSRDWLNFTDLHNTLRQGLFGSVLQAAMDPTFGRTVGEGAKVLGVEPGQFATPQQMVERPPVVQPARTMGGVPNVLVPPTFDINALQPPPGTRLSGLAPNPEADAMYERWGITPPVRGGFPPQILPQDAMSRGEREITIEPERVITPGGRVPDVNAPMDALQRTQVGATWYGGQRGPAANVEAMIHSAAIAQGLLPGTPEYNDFKADALKHNLKMAKPTSVPGTVEAELAEARRRAADARANLSEFEAGNFNRKTDLQAKDIESRIKAREEKARIDKAQSIALDRLRNANAKLAELKAQTNVPEREIKAREAAVKTAQDRLKFFETYAVMADKFNMFVDDAQTEAARELGEAIGLEGGFVEPGFPHGVMETFGIETREPVKRTTPTAPRSEQSTGGPPKLPKLPTAGEMDELTRKAMEDLGVKDLTPYEGRTLSGGKYIIRKGKVELVK